MFCILFTGCMPAENKRDKVQLHISVASSLINVMQELGQAFQEKHETISLTFIYGSSMKLARQIEQGAPVDVFLSASVQDMERLINKNKVIESTVQNFAKNELVLVSNKMEKIGLPELLNQSNDQIAIGDPNYVPLGHYTKQALDRVGLWRELERKFVYGADARQVMTYVSQGNTNRGIVYRSDALSESKLYINYSFSSEREMPIVYLGGIVVDCKNEEAAEMFMEFIMGETGQIIFKSFGFK